MARINPTALLLIFLFAGCFEVDGTYYEEQEIAQNVNKRVTALVATNINSSIIGNAESPGDIPEPKTRANTSGVRRTVRHEPPLRGHPGLMHPDTVRIQPVRRGSYPSVERRNLTHTVSSHTFHAYNNSLELVSVTATLKYGSEDSRCLIYLQDGILDGEFDDYDFASIGELFDATIFPGVSDAFASPTDVDSNGKIVILYYDMESSSTLGFFYSVDLYDQESLNEAYGPGVYNSNGMELFYMNIRWAEPAHDEMIRTLVHEFQHMVNAGYRISKGYPLLETWIDEGLAESAEHHVLETPGQSRIDWMNDDPYGNIRNGLSLMVWNHTIGNYALAYTFMQYLRIQSGLHADIYGRILKSRDHDYQGLTRIVSRQNGALSTFPRILRAYRLANLLQQNTGIFGYGDENETFQITVHDPSVPVETISLYPGGSITVRERWSTVESVTGSGRGEHIIYSRVNDGYVQEF
ncbi:MAG: hypothetical protein ACOC2H_06555 [Spirochaetota bacterium]